MVIDASVAFKWMVAEPDSAAAEDLLGHDLLAPRLMLAEVGSALWKRVCRGELVWTDFLSGDIARLASLVTMIVEDDEMSRALEIAHDIDHPIYDCVYMAVAERYAEELITADAKFLRKVRDTRYGRMVRAL